MRKGEEFGDMFRQGNEQTEARERYFSEMKTHYEHQLTELSHKAQVDLAVLQCVAVCCRVVQCVAVCCSVLQCVAVCCSVLQCAAVRCSALQCVAVCCSLLQCVAASCRVLQCVPSTLRVRNHTNGARYRQKRSLQTTTHLKKGRS